MQSTFTKKQIVLLRMVNLQEDIGIQLLKITVPGALKTDFIEEILEILQQMPLEKVESNFLRISGAWIARIPLKTLWGKL